MNGGMRSCLKLCSNSILSKLKQSIQPEMAKQRLYSTFWRTISPKRMVVNNFKSTLDHCFSSSSKQFSTESIKPSPVEKELLEYIEQETAKVKESSYGFEKKVDKSDLIFTKYLLNETISVRFNTNHCVKVEDNKKPTKNETGGDGEPLEYKIKPNFRVEITRDSTTLGFDCVIQGDHSDDGYISYRERDTSSDDDCTTESDYSSSDYDCTTESDYLSSDDDCTTESDYLSSDDYCTTDSDCTSSDDDHGCKCSQKETANQCEDTRMFNIQNYALYEGKLNENDYQSRGVGNVKDSTLYNIMKNLLREKGVCDEFLHEVIRLGENKTTDHRFFIEQLKEFLIGKTVWKSAGCIKAKQASSKKKC
ncbi:uncharacterized protein LOC135844999 [Planococcus citri]|uniref:uncharacterized protein LOC135844999 n=1 Tax=Planococcus citri TaxID=170843 RepID=UPI0031F7C06A